MPSASAGEKKKRRSDRCSKTWSPITSRKWNSCSASMFLYLAMSPRLTKYPVPLSRSDTLSPSMKNDDFSSARDTGLHGNGEMFLRREKGAAAHGQRGTALRPHARGFDCLESVGSEPFSARSEQPSPKFPASPEVQAVETGNQPEVINDPAPEIASFHEVEIRSDRSRRSSLGGGSRKNQRKRETVTHEVFLLFSGERSRRLMRSCRDEGFLYSCSRAIARQPMSRRQNMPCHWIPATAA